MERPPGFTDSTLLEKEKVKLRDFSVSYDEVIVANVSGGGE